MEITHHLAGMASDCDEGRGGKVMQMYQIYCLRQVRKPLEARILGTNGGTHTRSNTVMGQGDKH